MTNKSDEKKIRNVFPDRFTVDPANLEKMGRLLGQLRSNVQACDATRKDILNWIVEKFPSDLNAAYLKELSERFYNEERFLKLALGEVRAAKARGERLSIEDILQRKSKTAALGRKSDRKQKREVSGVDTSGKQADSVPTSAVG